MPGVPRHVPPMGRVVVPASIARALNPAQALAPHGRTLSVDAPPGSGETREEQSGTIRSLADGATQGICGLRAPWRTVGVVVDPGDAAAAGLDFFFRVQVYGLNGLTLTAITAVAEAVGPQAFFGFQIGARAELVIRNATGAPVKNIRAAIWGMNEG